MVDVFLVVAIPVVFFLLLITAVYLLIHYQHPDDKNEAWFPKLVVVLGFVLAGITVLGLPLDVANNEAYPGCKGYDTNFCGGLDLEIFWTVIFWLIPVWIFILIPFNTFYYESDDGLLMAGTPLAGQYKSRFVQAAWNQLVVLIIIGLLFALTYLFLGETEIPVQSYVGGTVTQALSAGPEGSGTLYETEPMVNQTTGELLNFTTSQLASITGNDAALLDDVQGPTDDTIKVDVGVATFYAGLMAWLGWFLFAIFGGIGIVALPLDFAFTYKNRTRVLGAVELAEAKMELQERVNQIVEIGEQMKIEKEDREKMGMSSGGNKFFKLNSVARKEARDERKTMREFQTAVYQLENDIEDYEACSDAREKYNPLVPYAAIVLAFFSFIISICWIIQIIVYVFPDPPWLLFLNNFFKWFDNWFPLFGVLAVAIFTVYLLFCAVKGCFKFGMRFLLVSLHPMKPNRTYMSSFMFNTGLVLFCALPVVMFCADAFGSYAQNTTLRQVYGLQIYNIKFFRIFWRNNVFTYAFIAIMALTALYLACRPRDTDAASAALRKRANKAK